MQRTTKMASAAGVALLMGVGAMPLTQALPVAQAAPLDDDAAKATHVAESKIGGMERVSVPSVQGAFAFSQSVVTPNDRITRVLYGASDFLCGAGKDATATLGAPASDGAAEGWVIEVGGEVANSYSATVEELSERGAVRTVMGCTCTGNPVGGLASVNAKVTGATLSSILEAANPAESVNTITFISNDGYRVSLPFSYVAQRYSIIVYEINGEPLDEVGGCANQLWLGSTSARYFAQNVARIELSTEAPENVPAIPGTQESGDPQENHPSVSVL